MNIHRITQQYLTEFPGDFSGNPIQRQTPKVLLSTVKTAELNHPKAIVINHELSDEIGLGVYTERDLDFLVGNNLPENIRTYSTAYAGHQFGNWAGQLGDGRAIFAGEITHKGKVTEIQWKGAGATPYSRHADGRAVLRSSIREYLMSEAMYHLGIPTTRALSLCLTGEKVMRDMLYNGNPKTEDGAVILRTAKSFLRFGHFEFLSAQKEISTLKKLADFCIKNYFTNIEISNPNKYKLLFTEIVDKTITLIVDWMRVGFVHGVMNTDNMSILGITIDYGPFSMLDEYDLNFTPNTTDLPNRRYAFGKQPRVSQWNLWQLANSFYPLVQDASFLEQTLEEFSVKFWKQYDEMMINKFGFDNYLEEDRLFFKRWQEMMIEANIDYTLFFNELEKTSETSNAKQILDRISYSRNSDEKTQIFEKFLTNYSNRLIKNIISKEESLRKMKKSNPKFILRNYLLYDCIEEIKNDNRKLLDKLLYALKDPYTEHFPEFSVKRPSKYDQIIGCTSLSCSS